MSYPASLDALTSAIPSGTGRLNVGRHTQVHAQVAQAVEALEAKVGVDGSTVTTSHEYRLAQHEAGASPTISTKTSDFTASAADAVYLCNAASGAITATLPPASTATDVEIVFKKTDSSNNFVTADGAGSEPIDDSATRILPVQNNILRVVSDGTQWWVV